ncbi:zinc-dependent alcohol dehydrogenase family protein [Chromatocurvus halotolerans]|uniref:NADPH:quinone reductase-like Zn-dependent oxidoreductase n=1 Tax=Chromatocurvus halotolerans TaxID=1132028 RepID=A0A4V2SBI2_9GAMM|nr:NAD(P)-dependent alcohol dehydrogenase [Chromatocurvus halotolerans]TCO75640.1 NADPH:quinone reductase-like Zn-dependent oxidoreductase [Chromatocurvus halotolerans]
MNEQIRLGNPVGLDTLVKEPAEPRQPGPGDVQVDVAASSLNFHDYVVVTGVLPVQPGRIPLSDGAGVVTAVGDGVTGFAVGDRVMSHFFPAWVDGPARMHRLLGVPGDHVDGFASSTVTMPASVFSRIPSNLTLREAATLPCAALTAWRALTVETQLRPGDWILVQGSGGVSLFALQFARLMGCRVIATSSSSEKLERLRALGAEHVINYREQPDWGKEAARLTGGAGVSLVVEVGGPATVRQSVKAVAFGGCICMIGVLTGIAGEVPLAELFQKNARISGITVGSQAMQEGMIAAIESADLHPVIDSDYPLAQMADAFRHQESQAHFGKICLLMGDTAD